jgi:hypothetical protein
VLQHNSIPNRVYREQVLSGTVLPVLVTSIIFRHLAHLILLLRVVGLGDWLLLLPVQGQGKSSCATRK